MKLEAFLSTLVPLDHSELNILSSFIKLETFEKGTIYVRNGQTCNKVSFIDEGLFKMSVGDSAGNEKIIEFLGVLICNRLCQFCYISGLK